MAKEKRPTIRTIMEMSPQERQRLVDSFDLPPGELRKQAKPLTEEDRALFDRVKKRMGPGRPKVGKGSKGVAVSVETGLLKSADAYARRLGIGRTELYVRGLRLAMAHSSPRAAR